ncbi:hypothetical protein LMG29542_01496 [Paraburkholderia humisilvae]|uniref:Uncharacterized protein n=1 Tax=Paraburkholderia humisilvae TaxID=627669 RepID=A0A6J5DBB3_9BURK|nr:hypothetical protein LMG29542_01496 [Paraburkholderia humisilvae]
MPRTAYLAFAGFFLALVCASPVEYSRLIDSDCRLIERVTLVCAWLFTPCALWLIVRRNFWSGRILAVVTALSMVFLRTNAEWLREQGIGSALLFSSATVLRFISLLLLTSAKRRGWFILPQSAFESKTAGKVKPPMPVLQAAIGILLGAGMMLSADERHSLNVRLVGAGLMTVAFVLLGVFVKRYRQR